LTCAGLETARYPVIRRTRFGGFWDFTVHKSLADTAYPTVEIGQHTDGTFAIDPPGYHSFICLEIDGRRPFTKAWRCSTA